MTITRSSILILACAAACGKGKPTIGRLKSAHPELAEALATGTNTAFAAILDGKHPEAGARCARPKLQLARAQLRDRPAKAGDTEYVLLRGRFGASPGETPQFDFTGDGPAGLWAVRLQSAASPTNSMGDRERVADDADADFLSAGNTKQLLVERDANGSTTHELYLVDMPSGAIACSFRIEPPTDKLPDYDPETGDKFPADMSKQRLDEETDHQLMTRFGFAFHEPPPPPSQTLLAARAFYKKVADGLARTDLPACSDADPSGAVRTTVKRLHAYAGLPVLAHDDLDTSWEPDMVISPAFRDLVDPGKRGQRDQTIAGLRAAPATIVVDIVAAGVALRSFQPGHPNEYSPGSARARAVRFDTAGEPTCQREVEVRNPDQMKVRTSAGLDLGLADTSYRDLVDQIAKAFAG